MTARKDLYGMVIQMIRLWQYDLTTWSLKKPKATDFHSNATEARIKTAAEHSNREARWYAALKWIN